MSVGSLHYLALSANITNLLAQLIVEIKL